ncbi:SGNH/GDSL hydrolase family protein [Nocardiopsis listeri]|uniref:SGNH/GDSL hydrolase family protein n=1 Tax=Nocardiopsis listeri TaxID=53440 RepID=UPI0008377F8D|nr:SGNH/GDSL hydrolase family protein [Nocardiopsis listeri]
MQDPGDDDIPQEEDVTEAPGTPQGRASENETKSPRPSAWRDRLPTWTSREYWRGSTWRDLLRPGPSTSRFRGLWERGGSRFEPGPLGLLGVMLAAMAVTMLLLQTGSGGLGIEGDERAEEPVAVPGPPDGELRIMPIGDSATQGSSGDHTWRYHLWSHLSDQEIDFDLVGPNDDLYSLADEDFGAHDYADPDFDTDHAARWDATAQELATDVAGVAAEFDPHYLLLLAGTEDILNGGEADHALDGVAEIVSTVRVVLGDARFVVGELPEVEGTDDDGRVNREITRFNMGLVDLAQQLTSTDSPVVVAQTARDYTPAFDNWDATHPNVRGELKIAAAFADALARPLGVGDDFPRPFPDLSTGPLTAPEPDYEETDDGLLLSWENVPGATDYRVVQRRIEPAPDDPFVLPFDVDVDDERGSVTVDSLLSGARYEFVVRPVKGRDEGVDSEPLRLVWDDDPPPGPTGLEPRDDGALLVWDQVEDASHYEVWVRLLECTPRDSSRRSRDTLPAVGDTTTTIDDDQNAGGGEPDRPRPSPSEPPPTSRPDPEPDPAPTPPPSSPPPAPGSTCSPRDDRGPQDGEGWRSLGSTGDRARWRVTVSGPYEVVVRSYRDYVEGGYSASLPLVDH